MKRNNILLAALTLCLALSASAFANIASIQQAEWGHYGNPNFSSLQNAYAMYFSKADVPFVASYTPHARVQVFTLDNGNWVALTKSPTNKFTPPAPVFTLTQNGEPFVATVGNDQDSINFARYHFASKTWSSSISPLSCSQLKSNYVSCLPFNLIFSPQGQLFVSVFASNGKSGSMFVESYDPNSKTWTQMGNAISQLPNQFAQATVALDNNGALYLNVNSSTTDYQKGWLTLYKYSAKNKTWEQVGATISNPGALENNLAFGKKGSPYIAYLDRTTKIANAVVDKLVSNQWKTVGTPDFIPNGTTAISSLNVSLNGNLFIAYLNPENDAVTTLTFNGSNWITVANSNFCTTTLVPFGMNGVLSVNPVTNSPVFFYYDAITSMLNALEMSVPMKQ